MSSKFQRFCSLNWLVLLLLSANSLPVSSQNTSDNTNPNCPTDIDNKVGLESHFRQAVQDAENGDLEVDKNLWHIPVVPESNPKLQTKMIDEKKYVLVVSWKKDWNSGEKKWLATSSTTWVTPAYQVVDFTGKLNLTGDCLVLRLEQYLGLPHSSNYTKFVEFWVKPEDLYRPCRDPEITDSKCETTFRNDLDQKLFRTTAIEAEGFPWTKLGYTYDWNYDQNGNTQKIGASEFIIKCGSRVFIESVSDTSNYMFNYNSRH